MADKRITELNAVTTPVESDVFAIVNSNETKKITYGIIRDSIHTSYDTGSLVESAYLSIYSTGSQALIASGSEQAVTFTSTWASNGVTLQEGSKIVMEKAGTYKFTFVAQVTNLANDVKDSWFWIKYNGTNFPNSTTLMSLNPKKNSSTPSSQLMTTSIVGIAQNDNDYIQLYWTGEDLDTAITETPATGPAPETPSIIANIVRVG